MSFIRISWDRPIYSNTCIGLSKIIPCCSGKQWRWWTGSQGKRRCAVLHPTLTYLWLQSHGSWAGSDAGNAGLSKRQITKHWIKMSGAANEYCTLYCCMHLHVPVCPVCYWWAWRSERRWCGSASVHPWRASPGGWRPGRVTWPLPHPRPASRPLGSGSGSYQPGRCRGGGCSGEMDLDPTVSVSGLGTSVWEEEEHGK